MDVRGKSGAWVLLVLIPLLAVACGDASEPWPKQLEGRWVTKAKGYEKRYFELKPTILTIETEVGGLLVQNIERLEMGESPTGAPVYIVHYWDRDHTAQTFPLLKLADDFGRLQLLNRDQIWVRVPGRPGA